MNNDESIKDTYLARNGMTRVFANATQAAKAAARLRGAGFNASPMQSFQSMRFLVKVV
jgi:hypothetical protein